MSHVTRRIGLSLGADLCWPKCFEDIFEKLSPEISIGGETLRFDVKRLTIDPFDLREPSPYDVLLDRVTHWFHTSREWIKSAILLNDMYVLNNPWSVQSMEKHTAYAAMMRLGMPVPDTFVVPPKDYEWTADLRTTLDRYAALFDIGKVGESLGYPLFMKPYDGGAWVGVTRINDESALRAAYEQSGKRLMHVQAAVEPFDLFVRCVGIGPQVNIVRYDPDAPLHARYTPDRGFVDEESASLLRDMTLTINTFFGWDFNSCEAMRRDGVYHPIDFANACPDSQVTSLHYHFPWLVISKLKWALFVAATRKKMHRTLDWEPYFEIADQDIPYRERLAAYGAIARERLQADLFEQFCAEHLSNLDEVAWEYFGSPDARQAVHAKVQALYPEHEIEEFTEHFWGLIQRWRMEQEQA